MILHPNEKIAKVACHGAELCLQLKNFVSIINPLPARQSVQKKGLSNERVKQAIKSFSCEGVVWSVYALIFNLHPLSAKHACMYLRYRNLYVLRQSNHYFHYGVWHHHISRVSSIPSSLFMLSYFWILLHCGKKKAMEAEMKLEAQLLYWFPLDLWFHVINWSEKLCFACRCLSLCLYISRRLPSKLIIVYCRPYVLS